ncbi:Sortase family protein [Frankineae bacterium MT45]|nr:Sortase family protein [Frankineae bacterium MT45]
MSSSRPARRAGILSAAGGVLLVAALVTLLVAWRAQRHAPTPPASAASPVAVLPSAAPQGTLPPTTTPGSAPAPQVMTTGPVLPRSEPIRLDIPAIGVSTSVQQLGLAADGSVQVPPLGRDSHAGWYENSPTPGQVGPSILLGHIDSAKYGPGVFFKLGDLRQREQVSVTLADHTVAVFEIERVVEYPKAHFPTYEVYGNLDHAGLRLITCGGHFDPRVKSYEDNIVVYASLISSHPASTHS